ncbi:hypothetical protein GCM10017771_90370 [Streptomyces capitiformicae]|uniref:Uncharacterized protein n=1 Tax=Streptomyces capitiformicae TaxID=2014920 RepID=A0A918ZT31_9ACTN|nr:hypothetical protein GCM10017771_90370 [Streptomyces capitiformicae]
MTVRSYQRRLARRSKRCRTIAPARTSTVRDGPPYAPVWFKATQPNDERRGRLRPVYAEDPDSLIAIGHVVALELATIAAANNYRR